MLDAVLTDPVALLWAIIAVLGFGLAAFYLWIGLR